MTLIRNAVEGMLVERDAQGRVWNQIFPRGKWHRDDYPNGAITYDDAFFATLLANWKASGARPVPIDYYHRGHSVDGDGNSIDDKVAAGFMHDFEVREAGLFALCEWTERGAGYVKAGELRYISPTFQLNWTNPITGKKSGPRLLAAGLLNDPFFTTLPSLAASSLAEMPRVAASASAVPPANQRQEKHMDKQQVCAALGMPGDTADEMVMETMKKMKATCDELATKQSATVEALTSQAKVAESLKQANTELAAKVAVLEKAKAEAEVEAVLVANASRFVPAQRDSMKKLVQALGVEEGGKVLAAMPVVAPPKGEAGHGQPGAEPNTKAEAAAQLEALAQEIQHKEGRGATEAYRAAMNRNPHLAAKAV